MAKHSSATAYVSESRSTQHLDSVGFLRQTTASRFSTFPSSVPAPCGHDNCSTRGRGSGRSSEGKRSGVNSPLSHRLRHSWSHPEGQGDPEHLGGISTRRLGVGAPGLKKGALSFVRHCSCTNHHHNTRRGYRARPRPVACKSLRRAQHRRNERTPAGANSAAGTYEPRCAAPETKTQHEDAAQGRRSAELTR